MSTAGWETVVSSKTTKSASNKTKASAAAKKKFIERAPKLEDVVPVGQIHSVYNPDVETSAEAAEKAKPQAPLPASPTKNKKKSNGQKAKEEPKGAATKSKNLEEAVKKFSVSEFKDCLDHVKASYSSSHLLWQREAASYLNGALATVDPVVGCLEASSKSFDLLSPRPLSVVSKETRKAVVSLLGEVSEAERQSGFETLLANLGHELAKGSGVNGHLVMLQQMAELHPEYVLPQNCNRASDLIKSYQNRPSVCLPLLWVLGQAGRKDLAIGVKVWCDYMRPLIRLKNYSSLVVSYLCNLLQHHHVSENVIKIRAAGGPRVVYPEQFFLIFDAVFTEAQGSLGKDLIADLNAIYPTVKELAIGDCSSDHELFPEFLKRLQDALLLTNGPKQHKGVLLSCLSDCVANNPSAVVLHWQQMYRAHLHASSLLLQKLAADYDRLLRPSKPFNGCKVAFEQLIMAFQEFNEGCSSQREGLQEAREGCSVLLRKMSQAVGGRAWFPWKTLCLLLVLGIGAVVNRDIQRKGSFAASNVGALLRDVGLFDKTVLAYERTSEAYATGKDWADRNLPVYYNRTTEAVGPYVITAGENARWALEEAKKAGPIFVDKANEYLPGAKEKLILFGEEARKLGDRAVAWTVRFGKEGIAVLGRAADSTMATVQDIIDGKVELKDVYEGIRRWGHRAAISFDEFRRGFTATK